MEIKKAVRHSINLITSISGVSGSGKTYSSLLFAAGLAGPKARVGFLDTENGRGCMYADSPGIKRVLPDGYDAIELTPPFSPQRYIQGIDAFERAGHRVLVIDSGSHEWEGIGGCIDMAESNKGRWNQPKREHKRFVMRLLNSSMHIVICLRAREKSKIIDKKDSPDGKEHIISLGVLPVTEKNFVYEMMASWMVEEHTHFARPIKLPEQFASMFPEPRLLTYEDGERIRIWNEQGAEMDPVEKLRRQARMMAEDGMVSYAAYFQGVPAAQRKVLIDCGDHAENKATAERADAERSAEREQTEEVSA